MVLLLLCCIPHNNQALEFAQNVPKPKVRRKREQKSNKRTNVGVVLGEEHMSKVDRLEMQHDQMRNDVDAIRREFGL